MALLTLSKCGMALKRDRVSLTALWGHWLNCVNETGPQFARSDFGLCVYLLGATDDKKRCDVGH